MNNLSLRNRINLKLILVISLNKNSMIRYGKKNSSKKSSQKVAVFDLIIGQEAKLL